MNQNRAPVFEALACYCKKKITKFHVPGHQYGLGLPKEMSFLLGRSARFDLSVLEDIDSLSHPQSAIKEAQELAAKAFGAEETIFLVNGSTLGVQAMIIATCRPGDRIIVSRNMHQSVVAGLTLSGAKPAYIQPEFDEKFNLPLNVKPESVKKSLKENPEAKAVLIISPNQFGITADIKNIAEVVHRAGKILLVDEAWGGHFKFNQAFPLSALESGADMVVQSTHKRLPALSQSSMLHIQGKKVDRKKVKDTVKLLQTTSPSYIILASLDTARRQMALSGKELWTKALKLTSRIRKTLKGLGFDWPDGDYLTERGFSFDPTNITIGVENGFKAWEIFNRNKIEPEFATLDHLVFLVGIGNSKKDFTFLSKALRKIPIEKDREKIRYPEIKPKISLSPQEASLKETKEIKIEGAKGKISAETLTPYPPGIPVLVQGETITQEIINYLKEIDKYTSIRMQILGDFKRINVVK